MLEYTVTKIFYPIGKPKQSLGWNKQLWVHHKIATDVFFFLINKIVKMENDGFDF